MRLTALLFALAALSCAPARAQEEGQSAVPGVLRMGGFNLFSKVQAPMSFNASTPGDLPKDAVILPGRLKARSCQHGVSVPILSSSRITSISGAAGNGGYEKALAQLAKDHPEAKGLFDVISDVQVFSVLGIYKRVCVELSARAWKRP